MKIGIDISQSAHRGTGVGTYTKELVENLFRIDRKNEYVFFFSSLRGKLPDFKFPLDREQHRPAPKFKIKQCKLPTSVLELLWNRLHVLPVEKLVGKVDIFHSSDWTQPPAKAKKITTVHDLSPWKYPETLDPKIVRVHKRRMKWVLQEADLVIADSIATREDMFKILNFPRKKVRVIPLAADKIFSPQPLSEIERVKTKYRIGGEYFLSVGTREPRKNLKRTVQAFRMFSQGLTGQKRNSECESGEVCLVLVGKFGWGKDIAPAEKVILTGYVPNSDLPALYSGAKGFVYPSLFEGFGLPVLEAMACGVPVVTSGVSSLPEVVGQAAILVDPEKTEQIAMALNEIYFNRTLDERLKKMSLAQSKKFSWEKTASQTLKVYREAL